jgi:hypothetical protein
MKGWTTEAIFAYLRRLGIDAEAGRFAAQAEAAGGVTALRDDWTSQIKVRLDRDFAEDFPLIAVPILWERLTPGLVCPEIISERLNQVILAEQTRATLPDVGGLPARVAAASGLVKYLQGFPAPERRKQFHKVCEDSIYDYSDWLLSLIESCGDDFPEIRLQIADAMTDVTDSMSFHREAAMLLARSGRRGEAVKRTEKMIEKFGDDPWAWVSAGDIHATLGDEGEAIRRFTAAFTQEPAGRDWEAVADRLGEICQSPEQKAELAEILRRHPNPAPLPPPQALPVSRRPAPATMPTFPRAQLPTTIAEPARKVGRNDPCPCGSGKKYKKCCLLP